MEVLYFILLILVVLLFFPFIIFIYQLFKYGPSQAVSNVVEGIEQVFLFIWQIVILPFTLTRDIFNLIAKLFKR